jgi:hypothetical protein
MGSVGPPDVPHGLAKSLETSRAEYRQLGKCGLRVSVPIVGTMSFGHPSWQNWVIGEDKVSHAARLPYHRGYPRIMANKQRETGTTTAQGGI